MGMLALRHRIRIKKILAFHSQMGNQHSTRQIKEQILAPTANLFNGLTWQVMDKSIYSRTNHLGITDIYLFNLFSFNQPL